ncbi:hypothetical protein YSY43_12100 [Paenibacillus sp. YSY-4.3]
MNITYVLWSQRIFIMLLAMTLAWALPTGQAAASEVQGRLEWERDLGSGLQLVDVYDSGQGYSVVGINKNNKFVYLAKLHEDGTPYWEKELELIAANGKRAVLESAGSTQDGGFILGATVQGEHPRYSDYYAAKITPDGSIEWKIEYSSGAHASFDDIHQSKDGGYLYANNTEGWLSGFFQVSAGKLDADGGRIWGSGLGSGGARNPLLHASQIVELAHGGYVVSGNRDGKYYLWRIDAAGKLISTIDLTPYPEGKAAATADGGYAFAVQWENSISLFKYNANDQFAYIRLMPSNEKVLSLYATEGDGFLYGTSQGVYKTDLQGDVQWSYGISGLREAIPTSDGGAAVIAGSKVLKLGGSIVRLEFDSNGYGVLEGQTLDTVLTAVYGSERKVVTNLDQVVFSSDDESIASVDSAGNITGHKLGLTYVRAVMDGLVAEAKVHVFKLYKALQLDSSEYSVNIGEPIDVAVTYLEGASRKNVTRDSIFSTSDPSIAFVNEEGNIVGLKRGKITLTASYNGLETTAIVDVY